MFKEEQDEPLLENFEVTSVFEERVYERYEFTFKVENHEFKGHYHENKIQWLHPHPKQLIGEEKVGAIESIIHKLMVQYGISSETKELEVKPVFEDKAYKRLQFSLNVQGEQYKGFIHEDEIQWFHPQPKQKLKEEQVEAIEAEIQGKLVDYQKEENE